MENDYINIEVKNNHIDYATLKKHNKLFFNNKNKLVVFFFLLFLFILSAYYFFFKKGGNSTILGCICLLYAFITIFTYKYICSKNIKKIILGQKEIFGIDELIYDLIFRDEQVEIITKSLIGRLKYTNITKIATTREGIFLFSGYNAFIYCQTSQIDSQLKEKIIQTLKKYPLEWIKGEDDTK